MSSTDRQPLPESEACSAAEDAGYDYVLRTQVADAPVDRVIAKLLDPQFYVELHPLLVDGQVIDRDEHGTMRVLFTDRIKFCCCSFLLSYQSLFFAPQRTSSGATLLRARANASMGVTVHTCFNVSTVSSLGAPSCTELIMKVKLTGGGLFHSCAASQARAAHAHFMEQVQLYRFV